MKRRINQVEVNYHEALLEFSGKAHKFDVIIPLEEYDELGRPLPGDLVDIILKVIEVEE